MLLIAISHSIFSQIKEGYKCSRNRYLFFCTVLILVFLLTTVPAFADVSYHDFGPLPGDPAVPDGAGLEMNWNQRHTYDEISNLFINLEDEYPDITKLYSIGVSYQERDLWCLEITNEDISNNNKTGIGVFANIHGGEQEGAESAAYTAWWLLLNSDDAGRAKYPR